MVDVSTDIVVIILLCRQYIKSHVHLKLTILHVNYISILLETPTALYYNWSSDGLTSILSSIIWIIWMAWMIVETFIQYSVSCAKTVEAFYYENYKGRKQIEIYGALVDWPLTKFFIYMLLEKKSEISGVSTTVLVEL